MITQSKEMLDSGEELSVAKLKQKRQALEQKLELLLKLDAEIVEIIDEDVLDEEIEQADIVREKIELAIVDLGSALDAAAAASTSKKHESSATRSAGTSETTDSRTDPIPPPEGGTGTGHDSHGATPTSSPASTPTHSRATSPTHSRVTTPPLELPLAGDPPAHSTRVKLPKLSLKRFNGDLTKWIMFWDTFESAVHRNSTLSSIDKFNYLNSLLESTAAEAIAGLTLTSANYDEEP